MLELGIDEATIVLKANPKHAYFSRLPWELHAQVILNTFAQKADFKNVFGLRITEEKAPAGYTKAYHYGNHNFYFAMAYHPEQKTMGVVVKFSAQALDYYLQHRHIKFYQFMHIVADKMYSARLSRIDLTADYIDEAVDTTNIYKDLIARKIDIYDKFPGITPDEPIYRRRGLKYRGYCIGDEVPTIYVGSPKSDLELRIYDKRQEQIDNVGTKIEKALKCKDWTRFELILKGNYAHQFTEALSLVYTDVAFANLIASTILQKCRFMVISNDAPNHETKYTQMLVDCINNDDFILKANVHKNYELAKNIEYMYQGSGILSTLYKVHEIWGADATWELLAHTLDLLEEYEPNQDCSRWLAKNTDDYLSEYPTFRDFLESNLVKIISDKKHQKGLREFNIYEQEERKKNSTKKPSDTKDMSEIDNDDEKILEQIPSAPPPSISLDATDELMGAMIKITLQNYEESRKTLYIACQKALCQSPNQMYQFERLDYLLTRLRDDALDAIINDTTFNFNPKTTDRKENNHAKN